jgi:hypothetical protein
VSVLAHLFEAAGIATVVLASVRSMVEAVAPPRALYAEFPLGRPLGKPGDPDFQHDVLARAFALLGADEGPILESYPEIIEADEQPLSCAIPPFFDPDLAPSMAESRGLRRAYERAVERRGVTSLGRVMDVDGVEGALGVFEAIIAGTHWKQAGIPGPNTIAAVADIRAYYEEAALELAADPTTSGRATEAWFFEQTEAGKTILAARDAIRGQEAPMPVWFYMAPGHR